MNEAKNEQNEQSDSMYPQIIDMIQDTLRQLRESRVPSRTNPLETSLETYRQRLQALSPSQLDCVSQQLMTQIMQEDDLSARLILKLMHDVTSAVSEGRRPAYLMPALI